MFDFDGVIADSFDVYFGEFTSACAEMGYDRINSKEDFLRFFEGNLVRSLLKAGFSLRRLKQLIDEFRPRIDAANERVPPFEGVPEVLTEIAELHPVYVITSNITEHVQGFLRKNGVAGVRGVIGSDVETSKVRRIRKVRRQHRNRTPYYIGDTKGDMREARRARAVPVAVAWGWHSLEKLEEGRPEHVVESPTALRDFFITEPQQR